MFLLNTPICREEGAAIISSQRTNSNVIDWSSLSILLIEDDPLCAVQIESVVSDIHQNIRLDTANSLIAAQQLSKKTSYDSILLDLKLSKSRGIETLERAIEIFANSAILVLIDPEKDEDVIEILNARKQKYLDKKSTRLKDSLEIIIGQGNSIHSDETAQPGYCNMVGNSPYAVLIVKESGSIDFCNSVAEKMFGYQAAEILGDSIERIISSDSRKMLTKSYESWVSTGYANDGALEFRGWAIKKGGAKFLSQVTLSTWLDSGLRYFSAFITDLSRTQGDIGDNLSNESEIENRLKRVRAYSVFQSGQGPTLKSILQELGDAHWQGQILMATVWNRGKQSGNVKALISEEFVDNRFNEHEPQLSLVTQSQKIRNMGGIWLTKCEGREDGCRIEGLHTHLAISIFNHQESSGFGYIEVVIDGEVELEGQGKKLLRAVADSVGLVINYWSSVEDATRLASAIDQSPIMVLVTDKQGNIRYVNPTLENSTGYSRKELIGKTPKIFRSGQTPSATYRDMWETILAGKEWRGEIYNCRKDETCYWESIYISPIKDQTGRITHFFALKEDITEKKIHDQRMSFLATHDPLTKLPNRTLLSDRLQQAVKQASRSKGMIAVLLIDLDEFKLVNDTLGHSAGDRLIMEIANRLSGIVRGSDTIARQGGDEFVVVLAGIESSAVAEHMAEKIRISLNKPYELEGHKMNARCSIGYACYPEDGDSEDDLIRSADIAMYEAKRAGGDRYSRYQDKMDEAMARRMRMQRGLEKALERDEFTLHFQPQIDAHTARTLGLEALIRWVHPEFGYIPPSQFISLAEESGLITQIGEWVIRYTCELIKKWTDEGYSVPPISVNVSALQFRNRNILAVVESAISSTGADPALLDLELTESLFMDNPDEVAIVLRKLRRLGVGISGDDFGTGYTNLSYLKQLPLDRLKIDRSFVREITRDPDDAIVASMVIDMGHSLGLRVLAEGVETREQLRYLIKQGCDEFQGFLCSPPVPESEVGELLNKDIWFEPFKKSKGRRLLIVDDDVRVLNSLKRILRQEGYQIFATTDPDKGFDILAQQEIGVVLCDQRLSSMNGTEFMVKVRGICENTIRIIMSEIGDLEAIAQIVNAGAAYKFMMKPWDNDLMRKNLRESFVQYELRAENERLRKKLDAA